MRILLADNESKVRSALRLLLEHEEGVSVIDEVAHGDELLTIFFIDCDVSYDSADDAVGDDNFHLNWKKEIRNSICNS